MEEIIKSIPDANLHESEDEEDKGLLQYSTYNKYLESLITDEDICYLQNYNAAKMIAQLGYRFTGDTLTEAQFYKKRAELREDLRPTRVPTDPVSEKYFKFGRSVGRKGMQEVERPLSVGSVWMQSDPLLRALAVRERGNRVGVLATIIFVRDIRESGNEVSGYIDYADRLFSESWEAYFSGHKKLVPRKSDLAYYDWRHNIVASRSSRNFRVILDPDQGLIFQHRYDRKTMSPNPKLASPGCDTVRVVISASDFEQAVLYDHIARKKL